MADLRNEYIPTSNGKKHMCKNGASELRGGLVLGCLYDKAPPHSRVLAIVTGNEHLYKRQTWTQATARREKESHNSVKGNALR